MDGLDKERNPIILRTMGVIIQTPSGWMNGKGIGKRKHENSKTSWLE